MAALRTCEQPSLGNLEMSIHVTNNVEKNDQIRRTAEDEFDYSQRAQWLRAAVLGANDGLVSVASLMMGVAAVKDDIEAILLSGFAGLVAGACSMAIGEFVSVYTQRDRGQAAIASALAFSVGAVMPLLAAAFVRQHKMRLAVVVVVASLALILFGAAGAVLGRTPAVRSSVRVLIGEWMAMAITFGLTKLISTTGL
ncbi:hypothetical protein CRYUN_Cryun19dG0035200 [Craigia yunnanensis]